MQQKKTHFILTAALALCLVLALMSLTGTPVEAATWAGDVAASYEGGTGTELDPYLIANGEQLAFFRTEVDDGSTYSGQYFKLTTDINLNNQSWDPIGELNSDFAGTFDGAGFDITGLNVSVDDNAGLFRNITGTLKNLGVSGTVTSTNTGGSAGGLASISEGHIINCHSNVTVNGAGANVGGVVGSNASGGTVTNCTNSAAVSSTGTNANVGGVVGSNLGTVTGGYFLQTDAVNAIGSGSSTNCLAFGSDGVFKDSATATLTINSAPVSFTNVIDALNAQAQLLEDEAGYSGIYDWKFENSSPTFDKTLIPQADITLTVADQTFVDDSTVTISYTGIAPSFTASANGYSGLSASGAESYTDSASPIDAGSYSVFVTVQNSTHRAYKMITLTINKAELTVTQIQASGNKVYDGFATTTGISFTGVAFEGLQNGDVLTLDADYTDGGSVASGSDYGFAVTSFSNSAIGASDGKDAGDNKLVAAKLTLNNSDTTSAARNYTFANNQSAVTDIFTSNASITKAPAPQITYPTVTDAVTYGPALSTIALTGGSTEYGTFAWTDGDTVPTVANNGYSVTFTPIENTLKNYETISNLSETVAVTVNRAAAPQLTFPTVSGATYGADLSDLTLDTEGSTQYGSFAWTTPTTVPSVGSASYEMIFTPNQTTIDNYGVIAEADKKKDITITVAQSTPTVLVDVVMSGDSGNRTATLTATIGKVGRGEIPMGALTFNNTTDGGFATISNASLANGTATYTWSGLADQEYKVTASYGGDVNYTTSTSAEKTFNASKEAQIGFALTEIGAKTYGDAEFDLSSTGGNGDGNVTYESSDPTIIEINGSKAKILKSGSATITATKAEDTEYNEATDQEVVTVAQKTLTVTADDKSIIQGADLPDYTFKPEGLVNGDTFTVDPTMSAPTADKDVISTYVIEISGGTLENMGSYSIGYFNGTLYVTADTSALQTAITEAKAAKGTATVNDGEPSAVPSGTKFVSQAEMTAFETAITKAENTANTAMTPEAVTTAITELKAAQVIFETAIKTGTKSSGSGSTGGGSSSTPSVEVATPSTSENTSVVTVTVRPQTTSGNSKAELSAEELGDIVETVLQESQEEESTPRVEITVNTPNSADSMELTMPAKELEELAQNEGELTVSSDIGEITFDNKAVQIMSEGGMGEVTISISQIDNDDLNERQKQVVGDRPVYDLTIQKDGEYITSFEGSTVTVTLPYTLMEREDPENIVIYYVDGEGNIEKMVSIYDEETETITFTTEHFSYYMIAYEEKEEEPTTEILNPFTDVFESDWFYSDIMYAYANALMQGISTSEFAPQATATRAMMAQVFHNMEQNPEPEGTSPFTDVAEGKWYEKAVIWASQEDIYAGFEDGTFLPENSVTRQQLATIFYRYAQYKGMDINATADLTTFADSSDIAAWATDAMRWAVESGLITGKGNSVLDPTGEATRAEIAAMMHRFMGL